MGFKLFKGSLEDKIIHTICILLFLVLFVLAIVAVIIGDVEFIHDRFFSALAVLLVLIFYKKLHFRMWSILFLFFGLILHHLKLYGNVYFGFLEFDMIMHCIVPLAFAFLAYQYLYYGKKLSKIESAVITFFIAFGVSSMNEIIEYLGYYFLGPGEGILYYGYGDFGGYADTAWDLIMNFLGALVGSVLIGVFSKRKK